MSKHSIAPCVCAARLLDGTVAFASDGAPSDCVALTTLGYFNESIDLVVSGINFGPTWVMMLHIPVPSQLQWKLPLPECPVSPFPWILRKATSARSNLARLPQPPV